ncbi:AMP-binding protein [Pseudofrankia sp. BMG5.37]|uniref:AMP-binding protein n=1 Tax=Pseudofrankia sp. BMG5.37 TaxID=3050035 RepID=UPI002893B276|nr:AMP-binding protein [Pseudofrankia sp. BMG5.37]MDT3441502.1 AMP-binding protein [Pseudofrankia sp. BMG5.37]
MSGTAESPRTDGVYAGPPAADWDARTFWELVERRAAATPDTELLLDDLGRSLTAAQFRRAAERVAAALASRGIGVGTVVSWQLPTTLESAVLMAALARVGATQNPIIPTLREREVAHVTAKAATSLFVTVPRWRGFDHEAMISSISAARAGTGAPAIDVLLVDHRAAAAGAPGATAAGDRLALPMVDDSEPIPPPAPPAGPGEARWIYTTSGTTADPKGVLHTDVSVSVAARGSVSGVASTPADLYPIAFPIAHIGGAVMLSASLLSGMRLLLLDSFDPEASPRTMAALGATFLGSALPFLRAYIAAQSADRTKDPDAVLFPKLRAAFSGGAPKPPGLHAEVARELGGRGVLSSWGMTEFPLATHARLDDTDDELTVTEGGPAPGVELRVIAFDGTPCPPGEEGELLVRGAQLFSGYLGVPAAETAGLFDADGFFRTGDLGVVGPRGHVRITGRRKDVIIRNAENIAAPEVEDILATHPSVAEVAVIGLPDDRTGERCCAVIRLAEGAAPVTLADLATHASAAGLAKFKLPEQLEIVDDLPRTDMGKVAKNALRRRYVP